MSPLGLLQGFISTLRSVKKPPAVAAVIQAVFSNLAELPRFHHCCRSHTRERLVRLCIQQMRPALDLCVFYWLWPSVNTVAGSSSRVCWCTQTGDPSARRNIQLSGDERERQRHTERRFKRLLFNKENPVFWHQTSRTPVFMGSFLNFAKEEWKKWFFSGDKWGSDVHKAGREAPKSSCREESKGLPQISEIPHGTIPWIPSIQ